MSQSCARVRSGPVGLSRVGSGRPAGGLVGTDRVESGRVRSGRVGFGLVGFGHGMNAAFWMLNRVGVSANSLQFLFTDRAYDGSGWVSPSLVGSKYFPRVWSDRVGSGKLNARATLLCSALFRYSISLELLQYFVASCRS